MEVLCNMCKFDCFGSEEPSRNINGFPKMKVKSETNMLSLMLAALYLETHKHSLSSDETWGLLKVKSDDII